MHGFTITTLEIMIEFNILTNLNVSDLKDFFNNEPNSQLSDYCSRLVKEHL